MKFSENYLCDGSPVREQTQKTIGQIKNSENAESGNLIS